MNLKTLLRDLGLTVVALLVLVSPGCSSTRNASEEPSLPREKWYAHCDSCKWCKGSFRTSQEAQRVVSNHNKAVHDWFKVAYYDQVKCP
jgi:hypothetical protein